MKRGLHFNPEWRITLFTAVLVPLMIGLGFWQLQRAEEKEVLSASFDARQHQAPASISALWEQKAELLAYAPVQMRGVFVPGQYFLLDNQINEGTFGYQVLHVLQLSDTPGRVLVNRGWLAGDVGRRALPEVPAVDGIVDITGHLYVSPGKPFLLADQQLEKGWPKVIQAVEMDILSSALVEQPGDSLFPYPVRIDAGEKGALHVNWQVVNMSPQKHHGYAVQWFSMAGVLFIFYLLRSSNIWQLISGTRRSDV